MVGFGQCNFGRPFDLQEDFYLTVANILLGIVINTLHLLAH